MSCDGGVERGESGHGCGRASLSDAVVILVFNTPSGKELSTAWPRCDYAHDSSFMTLFLVQDFLPSSFSRMRLMSSLPARHACRDTVALFLLSCSKRTRVSCSIYW